ncbi:MAG: hypothetical protein IT481_11080 [Gammaproteobacteria bacterium]|nr:hypothetical protein [Gammaproteobacteria bacterium]
MHRSQFAGLSIDCQTDDLDAVGRFWSEALGLRVREMQRADNAEVRRETEVPSEPGRSWAVS